MRRRMIHLGVVLTALLCLGVAGYEAQVWRAKWAAKHLLDHLDGVRGGEGFPDATEWKQTPWWGTWDQECWYCNGWAPRRTYYEFMKRYYHEDLGNDPDAWESWFKAHPHLIWDKKLNRLVDPKPGAAP